MSAETTVGSGIQAPSKAEVLMYGRQNLVDAIGPLILESRLVPRLIVGRTDTFSDYPDYSNSELGDKYAAVIVDRNIKMTITRGERRVAATLNSDARCANTPQAMLVAGHVLQAQGVTAHYRRLMREREPPEVSDIIVSVDNPFDPAPLQEWLGQIAEYAGRTGQS